MNCWILAIGNELINGEVQESNSSYLEKELTSYSIRVNKVVLLPDEADVIKSEIQRGLSECRYLFITGGLGPTEDDLTRYAVSDALDLDLAQSLDEKRVIEEKFKIFGHKMSHNNEKQSYFPKGAMILNNPIGTASGFFLAVKDCHIFVLPGVPSEMINIYENEIIPLLNKNLERKTFYNKLTAKTIGMGESSLDSVIQEKIVGKHRLRWEIIAKGEGVFLKFYPLNHQSDDSWKIELKADLEAHLQKVLYGYDEDNLVDITARLLLEKQKTFGTVESCTGGYVSKAVTDRSGSTAYFKGGLVTYSDELKIQLLGVSVETLNRYGAVSLETAGEMAIGGKQALKTDFCLSITGIAGPTGGTEEKPVGLVCFGLIDGKDRVFSIARTFNGDREDVRRKSVYYGLNLLRLALLNNLDTE